MVDMNDTLSAMTSQVSEGIESTMDSAIMGSFFINFVVSVSMKQLLQAVRVLQIISNFVFLEINFPPVSKMFIHAVYNFCTFKIMPEGFMDKILTYLGLKSKMQDSESEFESGRLLQQVGKLKD